MHYVPAESSHFPTIAVVQALYEKALTEPKVMLLGEMVPPTLPTLMSVHDIASHDAADGILDVDPSAPELDQYQAASACHWIATYCLKTNDPQRVSSSLQYLCMHQQLFSLVFARPILSWVKTNITSANTTLTFTFSGHCHLALCDVSGLNHQIMPADGL